MKGAGQRWGWRWRGHARGGGAGGRLEEGDGQRDAVSGERDATRDAREGDERDALRGTEGDISAGDDIMLGPHVILSRETQMNWRWK